MLLLTHGDGVTNSKTIPGIPVIVSWLDTNCSVGDYTEQERKNKDYLMHTIGFLVEIELDHHTVCWDYSCKDKKWIGFQHIPNGMIVNIVKLNLGSNLRKRDLLKLEKGLGDFVIT